MSLFERIVSKTSPLERSVAAIFIGTAFFIFILLPQFKENKNLDQEILQRSDKLFRYRQIMQKEKAIKSEHEKFFSSPGKASADKSLISALKTIELMASKYSIKIIDLKQGTPGQGEASTSIEFLSEGRKEDYLRFIYDLAASSLLLNIKKCDFKAKENSYLLETRFLISYLP